MTNGRRMNDRIPVTKDTKNLMREFADGLGATYDDALVFILGKLINDDENAKMAGHRLRTEFDPALRGIAEEKV